MKELHGTASAVVPAAQDRCMELLEAVDRYPQWHPDVVKSVEVLERDATGQPSKVRAKLRVERPPVAKDFDLVMAVAIDPPGAVDLTRVQDDPSDRERFAFAWRLEPDGGTRIQLAMDANLDVPWFLPLGRIGDSLAEEFVTAAARALA
ncbi:MAG: SRPBCC family protein [Solirubrobacterales bacterium]|nr:SRPBCC family protein [Solirubrobacterales bacterium]